MKFLAQRGARTSGFTGDQSPYPRWLAHGLKSGGSRLIMQFLQRTRFLWCCIAGLAVGAIALSSAAFAQSDAAVVTITAPAKAPPDSGELQVQVGVSNVKNLGSFQFVLTVDSNVLKPVSVTKGEFLGSSGREVFCPEPTIEVDSLLLKCVTLRDQPAGADGGGTLAIVTLKPEVTGVSDLALSHVRLLEPDGTEIQATTVDGRLTVETDGGLSRVWLIIGGVAAGAVLVVGAGGAFAIRRRGSAPTPPEA